MKFASSEYQIGDDPSVTLAFLYASIGAGSGFFSFYNDFAFNSFLTLF